MQDKPEIFVIKKPLVFCLQDEDLWVGSTSPEHFLKSLEFASMSNRLKCSNIPCIQFDEQHAPVVEMHFTGDV